MKAFLIILIVILSLAIIAGGYLIVKEVVNPQPAKTPTTQTQTSPSTSASPSASASQSVSPSASVSPSSS